MEKELIPYGPFMEKWRPLPGYCAFYLVSNYGRVWSVISQKILTPEKLKNRFKKESGYLRICVYKNSKRGKILIHRAVGRAWVKGKKEGLQVDHIDGNNTINFAWNLQYLPQIKNLEKRTFTSAEKLPF